jgi:hypothetical protein
MICTYHFAMGTASPCRFADLTIAAGIYGPFGMQWACFCLAASSNDVLADFV